MRDALQAGRRSPGQRHRRLATFAVQWKDLPTLGYTHFQPAQLTTVGKRACLWAQDLVLDLEEIEHRIATLRFRGVKGTTGTQASFLALFDGDHAQVREARPDGRPAFRLQRDLRRHRPDLSAQGRCRHHHTLAGVAASVHKICNDIRLLAGMKQIEEPFEAEQVGSSAMAYKRNPMRCERATGPVPVRHQPGQLAAADRRRAVVRAHPGRLGQQAPGHPRGVPGHRRCPADPDQRRPRPGGLSQGDRVAS